MVGVGVRPRRVGALHEAMFVVLLALGASWSAAAPAAAQGFVFEEEEVEQIAVSDTLARFLREGIEYYEREDFVAASIFFWRVITDPDPGAAPIRPRAQFELAKTLVRMRLVQSALFFFDDVIRTGEAHPYYEASAPWVVTIAARIPGNFDMLRRVQSFEGLFPDRIEARFHDQMAFMLGQHFYNVGELERALQYLGFVTEASTFYPQALFLRGVTFIRRYDARSAAESFLRLIHLAERGRSVRDVDVQRLRELAVLSVARTLYSTGSFERALEYYEDIPTTSMYWLQALFEASWANYQMDRFNRALGNLHTLSSPFFEDQFYPEAPILQAVIYFRNCRFREVRRVLEDFRYTYEPLREALEARMQELGTNREFFEFLASGRARSAGFDRRLQAIVNAALADRSLTNTLAYIDIIEGEMELVRTADRGWSNSEFARYLSDQLAETREQTVLLAGELVRNRLDAIVQELRRRQREADAILVETDLAEAGALTPALRAELFRGRRVEGDVDERPSAQTLWWTFDGEYWRDELGHYSYQVRSVCQ